MTFKAFSRILYLVTRGVMDVLFEMDAEYTVIIQKNIATGQEF